MASLRRRLSGLLCAALIVSSVPPQVYAAADRSVEPHGIHQLIVPLATSKPFAPTITLPGATQTGIKTGTIPSAVVAPAAVVNAPDVSARPEASAVAAPPSTLSAEQSLNAAAESFSSESGIADGSGIGKTVTSARDLFKARVSPDNADATGAALPDPSGEKNPAAVLAPSSQQAAQTASELPAPTAEAPKDSGWTNGWWFLGSIWVAQIGVEAWAAVWGKWVQVTYGMDVYTMTTMVGMGTSLVAGYLGGWVADKIGLKKTLVFGWYGIAAIAAATIYMAGHEMLGLNLLIGTLVGRLFVSGATTTAEKTAPIAIFKDNKGALDKYNSISQTALEVVGILVPGMVSSLLLWLNGPLGVMWLLPITAATAASIAWFFIKMNDKAVSVKTLTAGQPAAAAPKETDPKLLSIGRWTYPALTIINTLLYSIIGIGYGNFLFPGTDPATAAMANAVAGKIVSLYSAGGLVAGLWLSGILQKGWEWLKKKFPKLPTLPDSNAPEDDAAELRSTAKWIIIRAASMAFFIPMLWTSPLLVALAMIPFGFADIMATLKILGVIQKNTPQESKGKIMGSVRTMVTLTGLVGFFGFSQLFKYFPAGAASLTILGIAIPAALMPLIPFIVLLALNASLAAYTIIMARRLKARIPQAPKN